MLACAYKRVRKNATGQIISTGHGAPRVEIGAPGGLLHGAMARSQPRPLSDAALAMIARRFAVLGEPMRLRLIHALFMGEKNVTALVESTGGTQANVSRHLQMLTHAHLVSRRKAGLQVFYAIADPTLYKLCELVCGSIEKQLAKQAGAILALRFH